MFHNKSFLLNLTAGLSAVVAIVLDYNNLHSWFVIFKPLTTILIIIVALVNFGQAPKKFATLTSLGLVFCLIGDIFLLESSGFIFGLVAFLIGHLLFAAAFISLSGFNKNPVVLVVLLGYILVIYWYLKNSLQDMTMPVLVYMLVISFMVWQGVSLYLKKPSKAKALIALAVVLFMLSDTVLAINQFKIQWAEAPIYVLSTYWASLLLLANSFRFFKRIE